MLAAQPLDRGAAPGDSDRCLSSLCFYDAPLPFDLSAGVGPLLLFTNTPSLPVGSLTSPSVNALNGALIYASYPLALPSPNLPPVESKCPESWLPAMLPTSHLGAFPR